MWAPGHSLPTAWGGPGAHGAAQSHLQPEEVHGLMGQPSRTSSTPSQPAHSWWRPSAPPCRGLQALGGPV